MNDTLDIVPQTLAGKFFVQGQEFTQNDFLIGSAELLATLRETKNWAVLSNTVRSLSTFAQASGKALAVLVHGGLQIWQEDGGGERDYYTMLSNQSKVHQITLERYALAMSAMEYVPEAYKEQVMAQPLKNLIALGSAVDKGYIPDRDGWERVASATDYNSLNIALHESTDQPMRSNNLRLKLETDGNLYYAVGDMAWEFLGYLDLDGDETDPKKHRALARLIRAPGVRDMRKEG